MSHKFHGKWITDDEFYDLRPRNVFHRQLEPLDLPCTEHRNRHILFRKEFILNRMPEKAVIYISADDYYKLYINGHFVAQGPAPAYHFSYPYNEIDVSEFLVSGKNVIAVHTLYQGLINRVWQSGDLRHGLILDLETDGKTIISSDETFKTSPHTGYRETGTVGYDTQFLEEYDSGAPQVGFEQPDFNDTQWKYAHFSCFDDHILSPQKSEMLVFEKVLPVTKRTDRDTVIYDFGAVYVGYLKASVKGSAGDIVTVRCAQELNDDGSIRFTLRANCRYEETWILADGESLSDWFDYKSFRYVSLTLPEGCEITDIYFEARHYPFTLKADLNPEYAENESLRRIWNLCVRSQKYGIQEVIQDCMEREKGFYVGDGCYTALTHMILTKDDSIARKMIDDAFSSAFITPGLVTCLDCSLMQEIAEYSLMLVYFVLWHYRLTHDLSYLKENYPKVKTLLSYYRERYEKNGLLSDLDKWCVVEWPANYRDGYDVDLSQGKICKEPHVSINAYYIEAIRTANEIAFIVGEDPYRDPKPLIDAFYQAFYDNEKHLFKDGLNTSHISFVGNTFPFAFGLIPDDIYRENMLSMLQTRKISSLSMFCTFPILEGLIRCGRKDLIQEVLSDPEAWLRILREDGTATFEGWGKDTKWNTSLFHLTLSYAAVFLADIDITALFS